MFMEVLWLTGAPLVVREKEWWLLKQEKRSSVICYAQAIMSQLWVLNDATCLCHCLQGLMYHNPTTGTFLSFIKGSVSHIIPHLRYLTCVPGAFLRASQVKKS
jgi:hypothetical protein